MQRYILGSVGRFVGAVGGLGGCEADAVVTLDLEGRRGWLADLVLVRWGVRPYHGGQIYGRLLVRRR